MSAQRIATRPDTNSAGPNLDTEHEMLTVKIPRLKRVAEAIAVTPLHDLGGEIEGVQQLVGDQLVPHLRREYERRAHFAYRDHTSLPDRVDLAAVERLAERLRRLWPAGPAEEADAPRDLRSVLFELETVLRLHFTGGC